VKELAGICHSKWRATEDSSNEIVGQWAEDGSEYVICVPPQLRDAIIQLQNKLHDVYEDFCKTERLAASKRETLERVFGPL